MAFKRSAVRSRLSPPNRNRGLLSSVFCLVKWAVRTPLTSCFSIIAAAGGFPAFTAGKVSGSIPQLSTKRNSHLKRRLFSFDVRMSVQPLTTWILIMPPEAPRRSASGQRKIKKYPPGVLRKRRSEGIVSLFGAAISALSARRPP